MAWIESHQELAAHPKTAKLAALLGISKAQAIGHLHLLWWWTVDYAPNGDLGDFDAYDIAAGAEWTGDAAEFVKALVGCGPGRRSGFLDKVRGGYRLHDWGDYTMALQAYREKGQKGNHERWHVARGRVDPDCSWCSSPGESPSDRPGSRRANRQGIAQRSLVESTVPNRTVPNQTPPPLPPSASDDVPPLPAERWARAWCEITGVTPTRSVLRHMIPKVSDFIASGGTVTDELLRRAHQAGIRNPGGWGFVAEHQRLTDEEWEAIANQHRKDADGAR